MAAIEPDGDNEPDLYNNFDEVDEVNPVNYYENSEQGDAPEYDIDEENFAAVLEQKDQDLRLAAELGKALLEQNAELERRIEQSAEEYNQKLEEAAQEKYGLHLKLENFEIEYDNTIKELQYDISQLRQELESKTNQNNAGDKEKLLKIRELIQQNERLSEELQQERLREERLAEELRHLKDKPHSSKLNTRQQGKIEVLQDEVSTLTSRLGELERHVTIVTEERDSVVCNLDETLDKMKILERHKTEQDSELHKKNLEIQELQGTISQLNSQIEQLTEKASNSSGHSMTLFNELSQLDAGNELGMLMDSPQTHYPPSMFGEEDEIECDYDDDYLMLTPSILMAEQPRVQETGRMEEEIVHAYRHLKQICKDIKTHIGDYLDDDLCSEPVSEQSGSLEEVVIELRDLVRESMDKNNQNQSSHLSEVCLLQQRVEELESGLRNCQDSFRKLQEQLHNKDILLQESSNKMTELSRQICVREDEVRQLSSARDKLQDMLLGDLSLQDVLREARTERDDSFRKRFNLEDELHKARLEVISLNRQLMEAIHQRISMARQFDQLQIDIGQYMEQEMNKYHHRGMAEDEKTTLQSEVQSHGHRKSKSESQFDFLSA